MPHKGKRVELQAIARWRKSLKSRLIYKKMMRYVTKKCSLTRFPREMLLNWTAKEVPLVSAAASVKTMPLNRQKIHVLSTLRKQMVILRTL